MARSATTLDPFAALAEPKRRRILEIIGTRKLTVTQLVIELKWPQPTVSKHLGVLKTVGLVRVERRSRQMIYELDPASIRTVHEWTQLFERLWSNQLDRIKTRAETRQHASST
ncbi:MAG TPA: metalloregulator ArsR/SmtB family transcription factor, partial [Tepidisphaeraceae bacterium]|nr:metalloregulator ArsR/SmtB family transcription factor [Tepidisphaeraceae bacterium]